MQYASLHSGRAFSIIEVMIGIFIFSLGLVSIYALLASSLQVNDYNKNAIIASNLAREQLELYRNIRDTNYKKLQVWNQIDPQGNNYDEVFEIQDYYTLENDIGTGDIKVVNITLLNGDIPEGKIQLADMQTSYGLCLDLENRYTYDCSGDNKKTHFYRYLYIEETRDESGNSVEGAYNITSKVIWYKRGYHEYEIKTIVTDWRRI